jgi:hypothetical protein
MLTIMIAAAADDDDEEDDGDNDDHDVNLVVFAGLGEAGVGTDVNVCSESVNVLAI